MHGQHEEICRYLPALGPFKELLLEVVCGSWRPDAVPARFFKGREHLVAQGLRFVHGGHASLKGRHTETPRALLHTEQKEDKKKFPVVIITLGSLSWTSRTFDFPDSWDISNTVGKTIGNIS